MSLIILFGLPASGKTYVGNLIQNRFNYFFYDGDQELPHDMKVAITEKLPITDRQRDVFFTNIVQKITALQKEYTHIAIAQTFIKEKYRQWVRNEFPEAKFLFIQTTTSLREKRLENRHEYPLDIQYARKMVENFEPPLVPYHIINNDTDGENELLCQLRPLFHKADE